MDNPGQAGPTGVELYEIRSLLGNNRGSGQSKNITRYSNYSLHAKFFVFDRHRAFIGSMNFDQRSMNINTEIGLIIDSPVLAEQLAKRFDAMVLPANAYRVALEPNDNGDSPSLSWHTHENARPIEYKTEPARSDNSAIIADQSRPKKRNASTGSTSCALARIRSPFAAVIRVR